MKALWLTVEPNSMIEPSSVEFEMSPNGQNFIFFEDNRPPSKLSIGKWGANVEVVFQQFVASIDDLLPTGMFCDDFNLAAVLSDNFHKHTSVFLQSHNQEVIEPIISKIITRLLSPGESKHRMVSEVSHRINQSSVDLWFSKEAISSRLCLTSKAISCGISLRAFQYKRLLYHSTEAEEIRNVFFDEESVIVGRPVAKQLDTNRNTSFWALAPKMTNAFLFFSGIVKLVGQRILKAADITVPFYDTELFVHYTPRARKEEPCRFNGTDSDAAIKEFTQKTFGFDLNSRLLRQMAKAVFRSQLPQLFGAAFHYPSNATILTSKPSPFDNLLPSFNVSKSQASHEITISQIWHAIHGLGPVDHEWKDILQENHILPSNKYDDIAWERARALVNSEYGVGGQDTESIAKTVKSILDGKPFLTGDKVRNTISIALAFLLCVHTMLLLD
jgi:hypothetical protein